MFVILTILATLLISGSITFVAVTIRRDAEAAKVRDESTEQWLEEQTRRWAAQEAVAERAAEAMLAARQRHVSRPPGTADVPPHVADLRHVRTPTGTHPSH